MGRRVNITKDVFVSRSVDKHGDKYDYSRADYIDLRTHVEIVCPIHGSFYQSPVLHLRGSGCHRCSVARQQSCTEVFIEKSRQLFGDRFDYSKVCYVTAKTKVTLVCNKHGTEFNITPNNHFNYEDGGCRECGADTLNRKLALNPTEFIRRAEEIHGCYDYSLINYKNSKSKVDVICKIHGAFSVSPSNHLKGRGCPKCGRIKRARSKVATARREFEDKAILVHGDKYDYSLVEYKWADLPVKIICPEHGEFLQTPNTHLNGCGCKRCASYGYDPEFPSIFYLFNFMVDGKSFTGYGITRNYKDRMQHHKRQLCINGISIADSFLFNSDNGHIPMLLEKEIKATFKLSPLSESVVGFKTESTDTPFEEVLLFCKNFISTRGFK